MYDYYAMVYLPTAKPYDEVKDRGQQQKNWNSLDQRT